MQLAVARGATPAGTGDRRARARADVTLVPAADAVVDAGEALRRGGPNWPALAVVAVLHGALLTALIALDVIELPHKPAARPLVVDLMAEVAPPPPPATPEPQPERVAETPPVIVAPPPIVQAPVAPPPVATVAEAPPPRVVIVAPAAPQAVAAPAAPASVDLASRMVAGKPPRYPTESRRKREQGTVVLRVLVDVDGSVATIAVARTSGYERLDKAALDAVRGWRWSPTMSAGQAVQVRGMVDIPFVLQG